MIFPIENIENGIHRRDFRYRNTTDLSPITFILAGREPEFLKAFLHDVAGYSKSMPIFN